MGNNRFNKEKSTYRAKRMIRAVLLPLLALSLCAAAGSATAPPLELSTHLNPGLSVIYLTDIFVRHIDSLPKLETFKARGRQGPPIPFLGHRFYRDPVFDSRKSRGVAMEISGYIRLDQTGTYGFRAISNDGIRVFLNRRMLLEDPDVHGERLSPEAGFDAEREGWYPLRIRYFQRKGNAALELQWRTPGSESFAVVPPEAFAHGKPGDGSSSQPSP